MQPLEEYKAILEKGRTNSLREQDHLTALAERLMRQFEIALGRYSPESRGELVAFIEKYGNSFVSIYDFLIGLGSGRYYDQGRELQRLSHALVKYYGWLAALQRLTDSQLDTFEAIDNLLKLRLSELYSLCLFPTDREEVDAIAEALHLQIYRYHLVLDFTKDTEPGEGWYRSA